MPTKAEWILGFASAATILEGYFIGLDRRGLLFAHGPLHVETLNMLGGCILTVHNPLVEVEVLGVLLAGFYRLLRGVIGGFRRRVAKAATGQ